MTEYRVKFTYETSGKALQTITSEWMVYKDMAEELDESDMAEEVVIESKQNMVVSL